MLQDLDQLTARIGQLVQRTRHISAERDALRARLEETEYAGRVLRERCAESDSAVVKLQSQLNEQNGAVAEQLAASQRAESALRQKMGLQEQASGALQAALAVREADVQRLRTVAASARDRIDSVLARLPGAAANDTIDVSTGDPQ